MKKYVRGFGEKLNESSINRGAVVLVKGKLENGKRKLFATHVIGSSESGSGKITLFLDDTFYRVKEEDGKLKAVKISFKNEGSLKSELSVTSPGRISIVKNDSKLPFHWKTLKHKNLFSALREIESEILGAGYLLESERPELNSRALHSEFLLELAKSFLRSLLEEGKEISILEYTTKQNIIDELEGIAANRDDTSASLEWTADFWIIPISKKFDKYSGSVIFEEEIQVTLYFKTDVTFRVSHTPGSYYEPPSWESEVEEITTVLETVQVNFEDLAEDSELQDMMESLNAKVEDDYDLVKIMKSIQKNHLF